ncbi:MAG: cyclopropane-fatty-acyl-phospholipid synthase family protein [Lautropia sp.]
MRPPAAAAIAAALLAAALAMAGCAVPTGAGRPDGVGADGSASGAPAAAGYQPKRGQYGKDVVWIPTPDRLVTRMLQIANTTAADDVVDLGSGDGKIVLAAAREFGARGLGIEFNPDLVALSQQRAAASGVADRAQFRRGDIFETDFSRATVVTMYLLPHLNLRLRQTLMAMKPGTRVVSHAWTMGNWPADETSWVNGSPIYLWVVPANAGGRWRLTFPQGNGNATAELELTQTYQRLGDARIELAGLRHSPRSLRLDGDRLRFELTDDTGTLRLFDGRIDGNRIRGTVSGGAAAGNRFEAERIGEAPAIIGSQGYSDEESQRVGAELGG